MRPAIAIAAVLLSALAGCASDDSHLRLRTAIDEHREELARCYGNALSQNDTAGGEMRLSLSVADESGQVEGVQVLGNDTRDDGLRMCVSETLASVQLRPAPANDLTVAYTLQFTPT